MKIKVNKLDFFVVLLWISIFPFYIKYVELYYIFQLIVASWIFLEYIFELKKIPSKMIIPMYTIIMIISCIINRNRIMYTQLIRGTISAVLILDMFLLFHAYTRKKSLEELIEVLYVMSKIYYALNILSIVFYILTGNIINALEKEAFFSKGKFSTAYMFILYLLFFNLHKSEKCLFGLISKKILFMVLSSFSIFMCIEIECTTGVVAIILFSLLIMYRWKFLKLISNPIILMGAIICSMLIIIFINVILTIPIIQYLIENILREDITLTYRSELYALLFPLILKAGLWGNGFGSYATKILGYHGWNNAQNGLAEIILTYGFGGAITFLLLVFISAKNSKRYIESINAAILVFIIIAIVEVPYNERFLFLLALLMSTNNLK